MARHRDTRSPSPVGSSYSSSKRERRDDHYDRYRRRDQRRSRSRSPDRRYKDSHRKDYDRYDRDPQRSRRDRSRDRSRDRRRSRDRLARDDHRKSRERNDEPRLKRERDSKDRDRPSTSHKDEVAKKAGPTDEEKKAERLAKLEAWKQKQKAALESKKQSTSTSTRSILDEIDKKSGAATPNGASSPQTPSDADSIASPVRYTGKFDPKAIAKKADRAATAPSKLGIDITVPEQAKSTVAPPKAPPASATKLKAKGNVSGFGIGKGANDAEKQSARKTFDLGEDENNKPKLEKLPTPPSENESAEPVDVNGVTESLEEVEDDDEEEDQDVDMQDATEEDAADAARAAAEAKRNERLRNADNADETAMEVEQNADLGDEEDLDPLDAFMNDLGSTVKPSSFVSKQNNKVIKHVPEVIFSDDEGQEGKTDNDEQGADPDAILAMTKKKKKDIPTVDHSKVQYEPIEKSFYIEPSDLASLNEDEVADLRLQLDGIKVQGEDPPKPAGRWSQCGLLKQTHDVIESILKYDHPSAIQAQAIPAIMSGRDVIGVAKTGSGKTIGFLLPMFRHIKAQRPLKNLEGPIAIIMTPTRELATQIHRECRPFLKALNLRAICAYGGSPIKDQIAELKRGAEIVVCTPGRMIDLLAANSGRVTNLKRVTYTVLDEADRMFDMGFEPQVMKILANVRPDRQTVLFSATFPRQMEALARKTLTKPVIIIVGGRSIVAKEITQIVEVRTEDSKFYRILELLGKEYENDEDTRSLIFVERQESADRLLADLLRRGYPCLSIHGGKDQVDRDYAISDFKNGVAPILIATSVAARGLDVKQLRLVINYDAPNHLEDYVHRSGRTGRAGNTGTAVTFITPEQDRYAVDIAKALKQSGQEVPADVQALVDGFLEKVKAGKEKSSGSGFGGKGLEKLDQERDAARNRERKSYKTGEEDVEDEKEEKEDTRADELLAKAIGGRQVVEQPSESIPGVPKGIDLDGKVTVHKSDGSALQKVSAAVESINNRLNSTGILRSNVPIDNKGPDAGAFHATLEINDFPQKARWAVTNRTNVAKILEQTGTSITTKGSFYPTGKDPGPSDQPKLYILVEGDTEVSVTNAMTDLMRLLKDGTLAAADSDARAPAGRYSVV